MNGGQAKSIAINASRGRRQWVVDMAAAHFMNASLTRRTSATLKHLASVLDAEVQQQVFLSVHDTRLEMDLLPGHAKRMKKKSVAANRIIKLALGERKQACSLAISRWRRSS